MLFCFNGKAGTTLPYSRPLLSKTQLLMRIFTIVPLALFVNLSTAGSAQKISLAEKNSSLLSVLEKIRDQSGYNFFYVKDYLNNANPVTVKLKNATLSEALDAVFANQPLSYTLKNGVIVLAEKQLSVAGNLPPPTRITGRVVDSLGKPIAGASVSIKGSMLGVATAGDGTFSLESPKTAGTLIVSSVGYAIKETEFPPTEGLKITLTAQAALGQELVVTALGIKRSVRSLTYAAQKLSSEDLTTVKTDNLMNALNGKVPGATISPSGSGIGGSVKIILRGNKSAKGSNQPLYVIDGIPMTNTANANGQPGDKGDGNVFGSSTTTDGGDGISNLNPDDIESMSILEGASAAALYGSAAANGVILITTKKGKAGKTVINFSSSALLSNVAYRPKFQNHYGETSPRAPDSWGAKISNAGDNTDMLFRTGHTYTNSLNISGGSPTSQSYFSVANTTGDGVVPNNKLKRNNINFQQVSHFLNDRLTVTANTNYIFQQIDNTPNIGFASNPLMGLYLFPRGLDLGQYKTAFEIPLPGRNGLPGQNGPIPPNKSNDPNDFWFNDGTGQQNPWWVVYRNPNVSKRNRILINSSIKYDVADWFNVQVRGSLDRVSDYYEQDLYAGTTNGMNANGNGQFTASSQTLQQLYGDVIANFIVPATSKWRLDGLIGTSITDSRRQGYTINPGLGLAIANQFNVQNILVSNGSTAASNVSTMPENHSQIQSVFASANLGYDEWLYLTLTARNDWSSNLAFTNNESYFYPSIGLSALLNKALNLPASVNYAKVRVSYAQVGNTVPPYVTNPLNYGTSGGGVIFNYTAPFQTLKPEKTRSIEAGTDWHLYDNRLNLSLTLYKTNTINQFIQVIPSNPLYQIGYINAGNIENKGVELMVAYKLVRGRQFNWTTSLNFASNKNTILDVASGSGIDQLFLTNDNGFGSAITKGGSYGDIYAYEFQKDQKTGRIIVDTTGKPQVTPGLLYAGNPNPKWQLGWNNSFSFGNLLFSFLIDGKFGGQVMSVTQSMMDNYGVSKESGDARDAGGVKIAGVDTKGNPVSAVDPKIWYTAVGGRAAITGGYMYSATVARLRELSIGYNFQFHNSWARSLKVSLIGRNLLYLSKKAPYDPEVAASTGNGLAGVDNFGLPATRNIGLNLNVSF